MSYLSYLESLVIFNPFLAYRWDSDVGKADEREGKKVLHEAEGKHVPGLERKKEETKELKSYFSNFEDGCKKPLFRK